METSSIAGPRSAHQQFDIENRVAVITGAGQGIGRHYALAFAGAGARTIVVDIDAEAATRVAGEIGESGGTAQPYGVDITNGDAIDATISDVVARYGSIDVLLNNAAMFSGLALAPFEQIPVVEWERVISVNITGTYLCVKAVAPHMRATGWGRVINVGSAGVSQGLSDCLHYMTSKSAVEGMTFSLARELGRDGITVNAIRPGGTQTEVARKTQTEEGLALMLSRQCLKRREVPSDLVGLALFLASPAAGFITGQVITCDGGSTHR